MTKAPDEFMTELAKGATAVHELFRGYVDAGFTEPQALYLVAQQMLGSIGTVPNPPPS